MRSAATICLLLASGTLVTPTARAESVETEAETSQDDEEATARQVFGWSAVAVGSAAIVVGAVIGGIAVSRYRDLACPNNTCAPELAEDVAAYNDLRIPSGLTIFGGVVAVGLGIPFLLADDTVIARIGPGFTGVTGRF